MRKNKNNSSRSMCRREMRRIFACLLGLLMIPMNGLNVSAAVNQNNPVKTQAEVKYSDETKETIGFEKDEDNVHIGYFGKKIPVKYDSNYRLKLTSNNPDVLGIYQQYIENKDGSGMTEYYYDPHKIGMAEICAEYTTDNGESYDYTIKVNVETAEIGTVPIKNYNMYIGVCDDNDNLADKNGNYSLSYLEFQHAYDISWAYCDLTDSDLDLLKYATRCEDLNLKDNENVTDINKVLEHMKKLKRINIEGTSVTDFSGLYNIKDQLERLWLPDSASMETRFSFLKDRTYIKAGDYIYAKDLETKNVMKGYDYKFTSSDSNVIDITDDGEGDMQIHAQEGAVSKAAYVTVEYGNLKKVVQIVVTDKNEKVPIEQLKINKSSLNLTPGQTEQLTAIYVPDYATDCSAKWSSSNSAVASVDENGKVTASAVGTAVITATTPNGKTSQCRVTVTNLSTSAALQKVEKITIKGISKNIAAGKKVKLTAAVTPDNAANKTVIWTTSNKKVATVNASGVVSINKKAAGKSVMITATAKDGSGKKASYKIKVMKGAVKKVKISGKKSVKAGKTLKLKAKVTASKGANKKLIWTSGNTKYATVSSSGKVKALKAGKKKSVKITAMATDGSGKKATMTIKIK